MPQLDPLKQYANLMSELKQRLVVVGEAVAAHPDMGVAGSSRAVGFALELVAMHLRKVLELIAFSGLIANREAYAAVHDDFASHSKPAKITKNLKKTHPYWFPVHINLVGGQPMHFQNAASAFTADYWQDLYDKMGTILHVPNPFRDGRVLIELDRPIGQVVAMIRRHMQSHRASLLSGTQILVDLGEWPAGDVYVSVGVPMDFPES